MSFIEVKNPEGNEFGGRDTRDFVLGTFMCKTPITEQQRDAKQAVWIHKLKF